MKPAPRSQPFETRAILERCSVYTPADWRQVSTRRESLPEGSAPFADISRFAPFTEALKQTLGLRRGAEQLPIHLNQVYDGLIIQADRFGGSVIGFAGDAITCWLAGETADPSVDWRSVGGSRSGV